jgi:16S rRNA processing protein RimM
MSLTLADGAADGSLLLVGKIGGAYGVKGWVRVFSFTEPRAEIFGYTPLVTDQGLLEVTEAKPHGKGLIAKLAGVDDRNAAEALNETLISTPKSGLASLENDEYYWHQLEGMRVVNLAGDVLGRVDHLFETGANDVMVVRAGETEHLVPFVLTRVVTDVDLVATRITVDWELDY